MWHYLDEPPRALFDYGCGSGHFLGGASQLVRRVMGMDVSERAVAEAQASSIPCVVGSHEDLSQVGDGFDVVRMWHVLEHVPDPVAALRDLKRLLTDDGRLVVGVPNARSALSDLFDDDWFQLDVPRHLWHFDAASLQRALEAAGYAVERLIYDSDGAAVYHSMRYGLQNKGSHIAMPQQPEARVLRGLDPLARLWNEQGVGDSMIVVASAIHEPPGGNG